MVPQSLTLLVDMTCSTSLLFGYKFVQLVGKQREECLGIFQLYKGQPPLGRLLF